MPPQRSIYLVTAAILSAAVLPCPAGSVYEVLASLSRPGVQPMGALRQHPNGKFYGTASAGGAQDAGTIFELTAAGALETKVSFNGPSGRAPLAGLTLAADGSFFGTTGSGRTGNFGTVFRFTVDGGFASLASFTGNGGAAAGSGPGGLTRHPDGNFYGTTAAGGSGEMGTLFRVTPAGVLTSLLEFSGTAGAHPGESPAGSLALLGTTLYGVTERGGANGGGTVIRFAANGIFTTLVEFTGNSGTRPGSRPAGLLAHSDGNLYGTCQAGGADGFGTVFKLTPGGTFTTLRQFADTDGSAPAAALTEEAGGALCGTTSNGGAGGWGVIFRLTTAGGFTLLKEFTGESGAVPGAFPVSALTPGADGAMYGATSAGGPGNDGGFFRITTAGNYTRLAECSGITGWAASGAPVAEAAGSWLIPTAAGGSGGGGTLLRLNAGALTVAAPLGGNAGDQPAGALLPVAGEFFGVTAAGGLTDRGTFFRYTAGGGITALNQHTNAQGAAADGTLLRGADGNFYGVAREGGSGGNGTVFKVTPAGVRTRLVSFTGTSGTAKGATPHGPLAIGADGNFYGLTEQGGVADCGVFFKVTPAGAFTLLLEFSLSGPRLPRGGLATGADGNFCGTASGGGAGDFGTVIRLTPAGGLTILAEFTGPAGALPGDEPGGSLSVAADGSLWGLTTSGGAGGYGTVWQMTSAGTFRTLAAFSGSGGSAPGSAAGPLTLAQPVGGGLTPAADGWCYGTVPGGGSGGGGVIFRLRPLSAFEEWQDASFDGQPPGDAADSADPDGDYLPNLVEYTLGLPPLSANASPLTPQLLTSATDTRLTLTVPRDPARSDLAIEFQSADDPAGSWETLATSTAGQPFTGEGYHSGDSPGPGLKTVTLRDTTAAAGQAHRFLRLRVTRQTP